MAVEILVVPLIVAFACLLPIGALARPLAVLSGLVVAAGVGARLWLGIGLVPDGSPAVSAVLGADGFSAGLIVLTGVLFAIGAAASTDARSPRAYFALWSLLQVAVSGVFLARDLVLFFIFWEAMLIPLALLMWQWGGADRRGATFRFLLYTMAGSALLLTGIVALGVGAGTFSIPGLAAYRLSESSQITFAVLFLAAFAVKLPLFPFHGWLPRAYAAAPLPVALVLSGVVAKTAAYGIARICIPLFPLGMADLAPGLVALAAVGTLYGALIATRQRDTRGLIAFSSLSHLNLIGLAAFVGTVEAAQAVLVASVSHGLVVAMLFLLAGMLAARTGSFGFGAGGLAARAPVLAMFSTFAIVAAIGVPGTSGFAGEFLVLAATYAHFPGAGLVATLVVIVAAVYGLRFLRGVFFGPDAARGDDLGWRERAILIPLIVLILAVGLVPRALTDMVRAAPDAFAEVHR
jgi:NADH-quinone oxidoreductase subunit M